MYLTFGQLNYLFNIKSNTLVSAFAKNGTDPTCILYMIQPKAHKSDAGRLIFYESISGLTYKGEPTKESLLWLFLF